MSVCYFLIAYIIAHIRICQDMSSNMEPSSVDGHRKKTFHTIFRWLLRSPSTLITHFHESCTLLSFSYEYVTRLENIHHSNNIIS